MPYTHSLVAAGVWSVAGCGLYRLFRGTARGVHRAALLVGLSVFSHWLLDFVVHRPDLPLYDDTAKVGLGLWNWPAVAFTLEAVLLFGGMALFWQHRTGPRAGLMGFGIIMLSASP